MSEPKRLPLQTLDRPDTLGSTAKKAEKTKQLEPSFRFELTLQESNEKTFPEYNYDQLLQAEKRNKRRKELKGKDENNTNGLDPFASDDEDHLKEIARRFEAKYNTTNSSKKKRHKYDDYVDLGAGYDENDSFIDNTDAYDEIVPEEITTAHGGFYINCGALEFKQSDADSIVNNDNNDNDNEDEDESSEEEEAEDVDSPKRSDKRENSTSEEEELDDTFKKAKLDESVDKKASNDSVIKRKSVDVSVKRKIDDKDSAIENNHDDNDSKSKKFKTDNSKKFDIKKFIKPTSANGIETKKLEYKKSNKVEASIESVVKAARVEDDSSQDTLDSGKSRGPPESDSDCDDADKGEPRPTLPEGLSESVKEAVNKLKLLGENNKKGKTFTDAVNNELLSLDKKLRHSNTPNLRIQVFEHLAPFLHCSKGALASRAKKLSNQEAENRVKDPVMKLKLIIDRMMPAVEEKYNKECQRVTDENPHLFWDIYRYCWNLSNPDLENGTSQKIADGVPRRRFPWTDETKKLVRDIASARKSYFKIAKPRKQSVEDFVMSFMISEVLPLWPEGWMSKSTLQKFVESESSSKKKHKLVESSSAPVSAATTVIQQNCNSRVEAPSAAYSEQIAVAKTSVIKNSIPSSLEITKVEPTIKSEHPTPINFASTIKTSSATEIKPVIKYKDKHEEREYKNSSAPKVQHQSQHSSNEWTDYSDRSKKIMAQFNFDMPSIKHDLSITPVNDFQKVAIKSEVKKDVVSITPYNEPVPVNDGHFVSTSRFEPMDLKNHSDDKDPLELVKAEKRKQKKRERYMDSRHKPHENKIRPESETKDVYVASNSHMPQLSKEEQEQRQIEETMAATNVLSQLINSCPVQTTIDDPTDQNMDAEKEVQEVHNVMKSLKELEKLRSSPSHSPMRAPQNSGIYLGSYQDDYHRYFQKDDKMRSHKKDGHW